MAKCNNCDEKTPYHGRDLCLKCKPKEKPGRKSYGKRYQHTARLSYNQLIELQIKYEGSLQIMADQVLGK